MRCILWNINGLKKKQLDLNLLIEQHKPDIIFINETHLHQHDKIKIKHFSMIRDDRDDGYGGIATLINVNIPFKQANVNINIHNNFQIQRIKVNKFNLLNIYCPPNINPTQQQYIDIMETTRDNTIIMGDFNAQHRMWGASRLNQNGKNMAEALNYTNYVILNNGNRTRITNEGNSSPDLTLVSQDIATKCNWEVIDDPMNSDHLPILVETKENMTPLSNPIGRWNTKYADWPKLYQILENNTDTSGYNPIIKQIKNAMEKSIPKSQFQLFNNKYPQKPIWWDHNCENAIKRRRRATFKQFKSG